MSKLLEQINSPDDLKRLTSDQLKNYVEEVRQFILNTVSKTGGHLASNLGVVELTVALHYVFDFKEDRLLWDVGHQCYAHKIITGRKDKFPLLRQPEGLSGFPNPAESIYDHFAVGHAGTSIATAIGIAIGEELKIKNAELRTPNPEPRTPNKIVAVVGDASIVNGVSFEALNNLGLIKRQLLIVLNDNSMAIDATVGAMAKYFSKVRLSQTYEDLRSRTKNILEHLPGIGKSVEEAIERFKKSIRMVLPASQMFESLNVPYFGPVDGHDVDSLIRLFRAIAELNHPAVLHVYTQKGKGFTPADTQPSKYHSTGPFKINGDWTTENDRETKDEGRGTRDDKEIFSPAILRPCSGLPRATCGERSRTKSRGRVYCGISSNDEAKPTFTNVFGRHLTHLAEKDHRIVAITSAMCDGTGLLEFSKRFNERFYDVGIAESAAVDIAAGLARTGLKPFVCIYSTFLQRSFDQIFQEVALQNLPVVFCIDRAGLVGSDGPTHHGLMDIGFLRMMPNFVLTAPANEVEMKLALEFALNENRPVVIRYPKDTVPPAELADAACDRPFTLGKSVAVRKAEDSAIAIVSYGSILTEAVKAADMLANDAIAVDLINARFAAPVDDGITSLLDKGKGIITVEDHYLACGFGSAVLELASKSTRFGSSNIRVLGVPRRLIGHNYRRSQLMEAGISAEKIVETAKQMLNSILNARYS